jgi:hypothetical protein
LVAEWPESVFRLFLFWVAAYNLKMCAFAVCVSGTSFKLCHRADVMLAPLTPWHLMSESIEYGQYILWRGSANDELIVSSHGCRPLTGGRNAFNGFQKNVVPAGTALHFYGPDQAVLSTSTIYYEFIHRGLAQRPYRIKSAGQTYVDYELSKFQGKTETYDDVRRCLTRFDVVTIRHRPWKIGFDYMTFSDLLVDLLDKGHRYRKIHCVFCRSYTGPLQTFLGRPTFRTR